MTNPIATKQEAETARDGALSSLQQMRAHKKGKKKMKKDQLKSMISGLSASLEALSPGNPLAQKGRDFSESMK